MKIEHVFLQKQIVMDPANILYTYTADMLLEYINNEKQSSFAYGVLTGISIGFILSYNGLKH